MSTIDTRKYRTYKYTSAYAPSLKQYPHQASNGRRDMRGMENGIDIPDSIQDYRRHQHTSVDTAIRVSRSESATPSNEPINHSIAEDFEYRDGRLSSLPSAIGSPDFEHPPVSPIISDIDDRVTPPVMSRRTTQDQVPTRSRYEYSQFQVEMHSLVRSRSQPSSSKLRQLANTRRPAPPARNPSRSGLVSNPDTEETASERVYGPGDRSSGDSDFSQETAATSHQALPPLQSKGPDNTDLQQLEPVLEDDPRSWDLVEPYDESGGPTGIYALEKRAEQMFSSEHLRTIFSDPKLLLQFTGYLNTHRPKSIAILIYYLDALKALRAINYANAIAEALEPIRGHDFTQQVAQPTGNPVLAEKADQAFEILVREDLPAFIAHTWIQVVSVSIQKRITGTLAPHLREASEGLAEVFCLTDPSRTDNPIVFASEEFVRMTQYGMNYVIGRNCRFLQGPKTNPHSVRRLRESIQNQKEITEVFVNYRRDGSPFMNLVMMAPLMDSRGNVRYIIGAQVDVSNLVKECSSLDGLMHMVEREQDPEGAAEEDEANRKDEFQDLTEMFNGAELETIRKFGGRMHKEYIDDSDRESVKSGKRRVLLKDSSQEILEKHGASRASISVPPTLREKINGKLEGVYQHVSGRPLKIEVEISANSISVSPYPTRAVFENSLYFAVTPCSRHSPIAVP